MVLQTKSQELKDIIATYNSDWLLGNLSFLIHAGIQRAGDQLGKLSSPLRQLYYLAGLNVSSDPVSGHKVMFSRKEWNQIVVLLNEIEAEYDKLFFQNKSEEITKEWKHVRQVAIPSFLSYFNQGILNYEEQVINWTKDLFTPLDNIIQGATGVKTEDFIQFYDNLDLLRKKNLQAHSTQPDLLRPNWDKYTKIEMGDAANTVPDFIKNIGERNKYLHTYMSDHGIIDRFYPEEITSEKLPIEKVKTILNYLVIEQEQTNFLYYTETRPGNPLFEKPILYIGNGMYQVFEVKQVIHAINSLLEQICTTTKENITKYVEKKGKILEDKTAEIFSNFFKSDFKIYRSYFVDGNEQDILILWKKYAFIIETKGYTLREPFRNPEKAFVRIKDDFDSCIGYGYEQIRRVEKKFIEGVPLNITDRTGKLIEKIDTKQYEQDFSIIVNLQSFGQIQCDLSTLINLENDDDVYPWAIQLDDLEIFLLTMMSLKKSPKSLIDFLLLRETLHGKLICSDELEICGGFLIGKLNQKDVNKAKIIRTIPDLGDIFDVQYQKTMGFKNERNLYEKQSGKYLFW